MTRRSLSRWRAARLAPAALAVLLAQAQATDYDICIKVKDKDGTISKKYFTVTVTK